MVFGVVFYQALENQVNGLLSFLPNVKLTLAWFNVKQYKMLDLRLSMSYFDALVYTKVEIVGTTIKTSLELHSINVISSLHVKTL